MSGCPCACSSGGFCGGCGHAGCGGRRERVRSTPRMTARSWHTTTANGHGWAGRLRVGMRFETIAEEGCEVLTLPDNVPESTRDGFLWGQDFLGKDVDGITCTFSTAMIVRTEDDLGPDGEEILKD